MHCELPEGNNRRAYNTQIIDFVKFAVFVGSLSDGFLVYFFHHKWHQATVSPPNIENFMHARG